MDLRPDLAQLAEWVPLRIYWQEAVPMVDWCYLGGIRFTDPFFGQTIGECFRRPFSLLFRHQTPIDLLGELNAAQPGLPPAGFIFHMSRCGSTLITQMLAALPQNVVISEAGPIDFVLSADASAGRVRPEQRSQWLRWVIGALGRRRDAAEAHYFVKFDSWQILHLPLIQQAFPGVPWIFLYRDPVEVLASHRNHAGAQMLPGAIFPPLVPLQPEELARTPMDEYGARVLARICEAGLVQTANGGGKLLNYTQLPGAVETSLLPYFHVAYPAADMERMHQASQRDAKNPALPFESDRRRKQQEAGDRLRSLADRWLTPIYERLETARLQHEAGG
jgi:hypothetical protein